ncbi:MAG: flagellar basal body P-ring formation chaperone FlgA [Oligoflexales bacterium]
MRDFLVIRVYIIFILIGSLFLTHSALGENYSWSFTDKVPKDFKKIPNLRMKLKFKEFVSVDTDWIEADDLVSCTIESEECKDFLNLTLMKSPSPGKKNKVSLSIIKEQLLEENPNLDFEYDERSHVEISSSALEILAVEVQESFNSLLNNFSQTLDGIKIKVESLTLLKRWIVRPHEFHFEFAGWKSLIEESSVSRLIKEYRQHVKLEVREIPFDAVHAPTKRLVLVKLIFKKPVLVIEKTMQKGRSINKDALTIEWRKIHSNLHNYPGNFSEINGFVLKRPVSPGKILKFSDIEMPYAINRGQIVLMELGSDSYVVTAKVKAKQDGRLGDIIDVMYQPTKKNLKAKIVANNLLKQVPAL